MNRGETPFTFKVEANAPWLRVSPPGGTISRDQRISVSVAWADIPVSATSGSITVTGPGERAVVITVPIFNPASPRPQEVKGFVETDGHVSIEAEHFTRAVETSAIHWQKIPDFGRTLSAMTILPVNSPSQNLSSVAARLEYRMYLFHEGPVSVDVYLAPTQKFLPGSGFRYAISFDDETPQVVNIHEGYEQSEWERSVKDSVRIVTSKHLITRPGYHVLKFAAIDPGLVVEKLIVNTNNNPNALHSSYLGPPESYWR